MKNILSHLYNGNLNDSERSVKELHETEEFKKYDACYKKLNETFSEEQKQLFEEYFFWESAYTGIELEQAYSNGVKTGMCLALELVDFEPIYWK